jgi:hypothetical protein
MLCCPGHFVGGVDMGEVKGVNKGGLYQRKSFMCFVIVIVIVWMWL